MALELFYSSSKVNVKLKLNKERISLRYNCTHCWPCLFQAVLLWSVFVDGSADECFLSLSALSYNMLLAPPSPVTLWCHFCKSGTSIIWISWRVWIPLNLQQTHSVGSILKVYIHTKPEKLFRFINYASVHLHTMIVSEITFFLIMCTPGSAAYPAL